MTVYFDKRRKRWCYDFEHRGVRHSGYCIHPVTKKPAKSQSAAIQAEIAVREALRSRPAGFSNKAMGWIYFIATSDGRYVKIGWAKSVERRLTELQSANPEELKLIGKRRGSMKEEGELHARFIDHHVRSEWFRSSPELLAAIDGETAQQRALDILSRSGVIADQSPRHLGMPAKYPQGAGPVNPL